MSSELRIHKESNIYLIVCFGGMSSSFMGEPPFEFFNHLSSIYINVDLSFFIDKKQCWYHKGIDGLTNTIDETVDYLKQLISTKKYKHIIFMGSSAGGYASILFGSLCNVQTVIAFFPQTIHKQKMSDSKYHDLKRVINESTKYILHGDVLNIKKNDLHSIHECYHISEYKNLEIIKHKGFNLKLLRDTGVIKDQINSAFGFLEHGL